MTEGTFPKVDGDILYASEVNRFSQAGVGLGVGYGAIFSSGNTWNELGSVVINPNRLDPSGTMLCVEYETLVQHNSGDNQPLAYRLIISGASRNTSISLGSHDATSSAAYIGTAKILIPISGNVGYSLLTVLGNNQTNIGTTGVYAEGYLTRGLTTPLLTGSIVLRFQGMTGYGGNEGLMWYHVSSNRSGY